MNYSGLIDDFAFPVAQRCVQNAFKNRKVLEFFTLCSFGTYLTHDKLVKRHPTQKTNSKCRNSLLSESGGQKVAQTKSVWSLNCKLLCINQLRDYLEFKNKPDFPIGIPVA